MQLYSLTTAQHNILTMSQYYAGTSIGNIGGSIEFRMDGLNADVIEKSINHIIENAEGLRLCLCDEDGEIKQYVSEYAYTHIPVVTMQGKTDEDVSKYAKNMVETAIAWHSQPLYRFAILKKANSWVVVSVLHHLIGDAWTFNLLSEHIVNICNDLIAGNPITCEIAPYTAHIANELAYFESKRYQRSKAFWNEFYAEKPELAKIKPGTAASVSPAAHRLTKELDAAFSANIRAFCDTNNMSPAIVFEAATLIYLNRINAEANIPTLGLAVLNRDGAVDRNTMGMFISTVPLTVGVSREETVMELCSAVVDTHMQIFRHQKYPYTHIIHDLRERYSDLDKLYDVMVSYQNATMHSGVKAHTEWYTNGHSEVALALHIDDRDNVGKFVINMDYQLEQFADDEAELVQKRLLHIVEQLVTAPEKAVKDVSILPAEEYNTIIHDFNRTEAEYARDKCIHQIFEEQVNRTPNEIAVVCEGKSYTYTEINHMANCIAHALRSHGIGRNDIVPIIAHRSHIVLAAQFGVLKAGGAYLPIDPTFPEERISYMLGDASCKGALVYDAIAPASMEFVIDLADNAFYEAECENLENINELSDMCYVIYTSGSTGKPKGTMLLHSNVVNYCAKNEFNVSGKCITDELRKIASVTTIGFDIYVTESLLALTNGLTVYYANDDESKMQRKLAKLITDNGIEIIQTTPTKMKMFMQDKSNLSYLSCLKCIILAGEMFPEALYKELKEYTNADIFNGYGPTETTVYSSLDKISGTITIGTPVANTQALILNEHGDLCPIGIAGELCVVGASVGGGYWKRKELTEERFTDNRYTNGKLYKTGDLTSYRMDGKIICYGRMDSQVKIRGLRVELGEIESLMNQYVSISISAATVKVFDEQEYLIGYYVSDSEIDEKSLREYLLTHLPKYMCPGWFIRLDSIPFTPSGKIDRKKLPDVDFGNIERNQGHRKPSTEEEIKLYNIVKTFIKGGDFGVDEDFFDLGMDSLTTINLTSEIEKQYRVEISVNDVYKYNTVEKLCSKLRNQDSIMANAEISDSTPTIRITTGISAPQPKKISNIFITGSTGFLGAHILDEYLSTESGIAYCLVRGQNQADSEKRLQDVIRYYFGDKYQDCGRIKVVCGDITDEINCDADIDMIVHSAALVKHYGSYNESYKVNVIGTKNVIDLAKEKNAKLIHISTLSVSGNGGTESNGEKAFTESDFYIGQTLDNVYGRTKFEAEKLVLDAINEGLEANICRMGNLSNRYTDAVFQPNYPTNAFLLRLKAILELGMIPESMANYAIEFTPIDYAAKAVMCIASHFNLDRTIYHISNPKVLSMPVLSQILQAFGIQLKVVLDTVFADTLKGMMSTDAEVYKTINLVFTMDRGSMRLYDSHIHIKNELSVNYLQSLGFTWCDIDKRYLGKWIAYFSSNGFILTLN